MRQQRTTQVRTPKTGIQVNMPPAMQAYLPTTGPVHPLLRLQRTIGNRAVQGLIQAKLKIGQPDDKYEQEADRVADQVMRMPAPGVQRQVEPEEEEEETLQTQPLADHITPLVQRQVEDEEEETLQPKLLSGQMAGLIQRQMEDEDEEESIQTKSLSEPLPASLVQRKCVACASGQELCPKCAAEEGLQRQSLASPITPLIQCHNEEPVERAVQTKLIYPSQSLLQRQEELEEEDEALQSKETSDHTPEVTPEIVANINALRGGGQPLSQSMRAFFEPRFSYDFSQVRVHAEAQAAKSAHALNAQAFTIGRDVVFGVGKYTPSTTEAKRLLAHELTHVVQQSGDKVHHTADNIIQRDVDAAHMHCTPGVAGASANPLQDIQDAEFGAFALIKNALEYVEDEIARFGTAGYVPNAEIQDALRRRFRRTHDLTTTRSQRLLRVIASRMNTLIRIIERGTLHYTCNRFRCDADDYASSIVRGSGIDLCPRFWAEHPERPGTILHELYHIWWDYEDTGRLRNANCHEHFIRDLNGDVVAGPAECRPLI